MPYYMNFKFQDFSNFNCMNISYFNDYLNSFLILILMMILMLIFILMKYSFYLSLNKNIDSNMLEMFWTLIPSMMILMISIPSMIMLYFTDEFKKPLMDLKILGNQWYWSYMFMNLNFFNSYIFSSLINRCISTDNSIILPSMINVRTLISSTDVIHSWTIPSIMIKMDAIPGRLNSFNMMSEKSMKMKGQCSEICGSNHSFMPISLMMMNFSSKKFFKYNFLNYKSFYLWWNYQISPMNWILAFFMIFVMTSSFSFKKMNFLMKMFKKNKYLKKLYAF